MRVAKGLANVIVDQTSISDVQATGLLSYRGRSVEDLVDQDFTSVASLLLGGVEGLPDRLAAHANLDPAETRLVLAMSPQLHPMSVLQAMVPLVAGSDEESVLDQGLRIAAKLPAIVATLINREPVVLDVDLTYAHRFLFAIGGPQDDAAQRAFNTAQILQLEHSFNAGTFACRVVGSTQASIGAAISAGIGALSGPLHGGADQAALEIVDQHLDEAALTQYVDAILAQGGRVPGMGHREYRVRDPRAIYLQEWAEKLARNSEHAATYERLRFLDQLFCQRMLARDKQVYPNVEFYKGLVYRVLGLPNRFFTAGFAMARVFGYIAHFSENAQDNRIYRPQAEYVEDLH